MGGADAVERLHVSAFLLGERLDLRGLSRAAPGTAESLPVEIPGARAAFVFRWGALVLFGADAAAEAAARGLLHPRLTGCLTVSVEERAVLSIGGKDGVEADGTITLAEADWARFALVADAIAKSAALSHQEASLAETLDGMDPVIARLKRQGRVGVTSRTLLRAVGAALDARSRATVPRCSTASSSWWVRRSDRCSRSSRRGGASASRSRSWR